MTDHVYVFLYDAAPFRGIESERVRDDVVGGTLFDVAGVGAALMLSGHSRVPGTIRRIRADALDALDQAVGVHDGLYRRVGVRVGDTPCWTWVAGPELAQRLAASRVRETENS
jgi:gamma-glutamylcyclotransferase (GGCT)/AIG2-like uncharacterized protein YtfP